ncbi:DinB family protein [Sediminibacillus terrae]|uniref:DinB family protein n=1 Tax=Sediminibacillus terrae TaxID=1562106 RepID=UPI0004172EEE
MENTNEMREVGMETRHRILFRQMETYRTELLDAVLPVTEEEADFVPPGFNNNIRWNLGHVYLDQFLWLETLTKEKQNVPHEYHSWFGFGSSPADFTAETPSLETIKRLLTRQPGDIKERYGERMDETFPATEMGMHTIEQVLVRTIFHEGMHLQKVMDIRQQLSKTDCKQI